MKILLIGIIAIGVLVVVLAHAVLARHERKRKAWVSNICVKG
jgi:hypothetical protein